MIEKEFGNVRLSRLGLGNMRLPTKNGRIDEERAAAIVDEALASGTNYFIRPMSIIPGNPSLFWGEP